MEHRRTTWGVAIRLAIALSAAASVTALGLERLGLAQPAIVLTVIVVGFATSWVRTGQIAAAPDRRRSHRLATVPVHHVHHPIA